MPRPLGPLTHLPAALLMLALVPGCGDADNGVRDDTVPSAPPGPSQGGYPPFPDQDYTYTLTVLCFCPDAGTPITVAVADGEVTEARFLQDATGRGTARAGDPAPEYARLTIDDVIEAAEDPGAFRVEVEWPAGQDHPDQVRVDLAEGVADDERTYTIADVITR